MAFERGKSQQMTRRTTTLPASVTAESVASIDALIQSQVGELTASDGTIFGRAIATANAIATLRAAITPDMMTGIMALQGSKLGFKTDKDRDGGYPAEVVKECLIEALLFGALPTGNEMNIIAGNFYATLECFRRRIPEFPGLTDWEMSLGIPVIHEKGACVECHATWKIDGVPMSISFAKTEKHDNRIAMKHNSSNNYDNVLGKAERKLRARAWQKITGCVRTLDGDLDDAPVRGAIECNWNEQLARDIEAAGDETRCIEVEKAIHAQWQTGDCDGAELLSLLADRRAALGAK